MAIYKKTDWIIVFINKLAKIFFAKVAKKGLSGQKKEWCSTL